LDSNGWLIDKFFSSETELALHLRWRSGFRSLGLLSFFLPDTPPKAKGTTATFRQILGADAFVLF